MADVAALAGVAISTVSRALANPGRVNEKTRSKIAAAADKLGYTPNAMARGLRVGKSDIIMIVLPGSLQYGASQIIPQVLHSINQTLLRNGYTLMIANLDRDETSERHVLNLAFGGSVRATIILSSELPVVGGRSLADAGLPIISMLRDLSEFSVPSVVTDDRQAMRAATSELIALGHRSFLYIAGPAGNYHDVERYQGVLDALHDGGLTEQDVVRSGGLLGYQHGFQIGIEAAEDFDRLPDKPTAVIATEDDMAITFMSCVRAKGWRIPEDLSIVGFDCAPVSEFCEPPLSSLRQPVEEMGTLAAENLLRRLSDPTWDIPLKSVLPSVFVKRRSMGPVRVASAT